MNKVLVITMKGQLSDACMWVNVTLPEIYQQHILDKIDVMKLQHLILCHLDKPILTLASHTYANQLKQCTSIVMATPTKQNPLNHSLHSCIVKNLLILPLQKW